MKVITEELEVRAVYFSLDDYDDAKLLTEAAKFLEELRQRPGETWLVLGMNRQADDYGSHLTLFLERRLVVQPRPPRPATDVATPKEPKIRYLPT